MLFEGTEARYQQLADELTRQIQSGALKPRQRLLSEPALAKNYGVSRVTVRGAIGILERRGLVVRRRGVGTFVVGVRVRQELSRLGGFIDAMVDQGLQPHARLLEYRLVTLSPLLADRIKHDDAMLLVRQFWIEDQPVSLTRAYLHPDAAAASWRDVEDHTVVQIIERFTKRRIEKVDVKIRADAAGEQAQYLGLHAHEPMLVFERTSDAEDGCGLEFTTWFLRPDVYEFGMQMHGPFELADGFHHPASLLAQ